MTDNHQYRKQVSVTATLSALSRNMAFAYRRIAERAGEPTFLDDESSMATQRVDFVCGPNNVTLLRPVNDAARLIRRADDIFGSRRYMVWTMWPVDLTPFGFVRSESPAMVRDPSGTDEISVDMSITEVLDATAVEAFEDTLSAGFGYEQRNLSLVGMLGPNAPGDERLRFWLGRVRGRPVAVSFSAVSDGYTGVYGVTTVPDARRRGYGEAMTRAALSAAAEHPAALQASAMGKPLYEAMGFREVARFEVWRPAPKQ